MPIGLAQRDESRLPALDGLRAVAVLAVVFFHAHWLRGGWSGVDVFFVLSGFLITTNLAREEETTGGVRLDRFYMRRMLRLTPAFWALLLVTALLVPFRKHPMETVHAIALGFSYTMNWARAFALFPDDLLDHTWSLATEEQFYLLWPIFFILVPGHARVPALGLAFVGEITWRVLLVAGGAHYERTYNGFDTHGDGLILGCLLALIPLPARFAEMARRFAAVPLIGLAALFLDLQINTGLAQSIGLTITAVLSAWVIVVAAGGTGTIASMLAWRPLVSVGRVSYGFYLWHFPVFILFYSKVAAWGVPALVAVSFGLAYLSYRFVEQPFLRLKTRFEPLRPATAVPSVTLQSPVQAM